jgi:hypothetical protein
MENWKIVCSLTVSFRQCSSQYDVPKFICKFAPILKPKVVDTLYGEILNQLDMVDIFITQI